MKNDDKYSDVFKKVFCSRSCASKYGHATTDKNKTTTVKSARIDTDFSDDELIKFYNESKNITDLERKINYKNILSQDRVVNRFLSLGLNIENLKRNNVDISVFTKNELFKKYEQWQTARSTIQKDARRTYINSNKSKQCIVCDYDKHYEVAHIKPVSDFDGNVLVSEINNIDNLIALCPNHHLEYDNGYLDILPYLN